LQQGDLIASVPVVKLPPALLLLRARQEQQDLEHGTLAQLVEASQLPDAFADGLEWIAVTALVAHVIVLSQTCDIEHREFVAISPVYPLGAISNPDTTGAVRQGKVHHRFFLPAAEAHCLPEATDLPDSWAELSVINSVPRDRLPLDERIASLTVQGQNRLAAHLNRFFTRPA